MNIPEHITVNEGGPERYDLACSVCQIGWSGGASFGPIAGANLAASFIVQHATHDKKDRRRGAPVSGALDDNPRALGALR